MSDASAVAQDQLRSFVERILRLKEEQDTLASDIKDVYAEAKGQGFDKTALGALVAELRKRARDPNKADELGSILDLYRDAYNGTSASHAHAYAREAA